MEDQARACQRLWMTVLVQAICDAKIVGSGTAGNLREKALAETQSKSWIQRAGKDFKQVCEFAGFDWWYVKEKIDKLQNDPLGLEKFIKRLKAFTLINRDMRSSKISHSTKVGRSPKKLGRLKFA